MDFISALTAFKSWALDAIPKAISTNRALREEIRTIIGDLADDLMNGLNIVSMRLKAAKRIANEQEFLDYMADSEQQIYTSFQEFRVCADIRNLEDRLKRSFDATRGAIEIGNIQAVQQLISSLSNHEQLIFDMINTPWEHIRTALVQQQSRVEIEQRMDDAIEDCDRRRDEVKLLARTILEKV